MQITGFQTRELGDVIGLNIFNIVSGFLQKLAEDRGIDDLPGPVMRGDLDRIL